MNNFTKFLGLILGCLVCFPGLARPAGDPVKEHLAPPAIQAAYVARPQNDSCQFAVVLTPGTTCVPTAGTTIDAGPSRPAITCNGATGTANDDVWYQFTATAANHTVTVDGDAGFDAVIDVRTSCFGATIGCADATTGGGTEIVALTGLTIGTTYIVRVYGYGATTATNGTFNICVTTPPPNDDCANAVTLTPGALGAACTPTAGTTVGATQSLAAIACNNFTGTADDDVWYQFTATAANHKVTVTVGAGFDAVIDVRSGNCNGTNIACADATFNGPTETAVLSGLTVGATYLVRVYRLRQCRWHQRHLQHLCNYAVAE